MSEIRVNRVVAADGSGAPQFPSGLSLATGMGITNSPNITGSAVTFSGISKVTNATDSTSSTTGSLIITGGLGVAKNVFIGAGLSVAGTLTYEDATNIDSVGLITAQSGIRVPGGEVTVGVAYSVGNAGVCTAAGFVGPLTGTLQTAAQTNITSLGSLTGLTVTGDVTFDNGTNAGKDITFDASADALIFNDDTKAIFGTSSDGVEIFHDGSNSRIKDTGTGALKLSGSEIVFENGATNETMATFAENGAVSLYYDNGTRFTTTGAGSTSVGISTVQDFSAVGMLKERVTVVANKLSAGTNVDVAKGNIHYYTTNETATATPNIRYDGTDTLNNKMLIGDVVTVTIISKPNNAGYYANVTIDGNAVTEEWNGGDAPSLASQSGYDVLTHTITKTANATFLVLSNTQNYA